MKVSVLITAAVVLALPGVVPNAQAQHLNPVIDLLQARKPVFGLYAPANPRRGGGRGGRGAAAPVAPAPGVDTTTKTPAQLAATALAYQGADYIFDGSMESNFDVGYPAFTEFAKGMVAGGQLKTKGKLYQPLFVKTPEIAPNPALAAERIAKQLNTGAMGIVLVSVESAEETRQGIAAMRFKSKGGTRPDDVGGAPAVWGLSEKEYKEKADVWPLNPKGELVNFTIVESLEGLKHVDEIAAVPGIGVLFPGAGTLGGLFSTTDSAGNRKRDDVAWEAAIQQVLAACKKHKVVCGYPTRSTDIEMRMKQGFSVQIIGWGEDGFKAVELGRKAGGR